MAAFLLICLVFILSSSVSWATVDLALNHDGPPLCGGRIANFKCSTTTMSGGLRWDVNSVQMFLLDDSAIVGQNLTTNGNTFVFTEADTVSGVNVYTSTAELNSTTPNVTVVCSDGGIPESLTLNISNDIYTPNNLRCTNIEERNVQFEWDTPINAGVCCNQYRVMTSNGTTVTSETSFTMDMYNVLQDNASISVSCVDMLGTSGREVVFTPNIIDVSIPEPVGDICSSEVTYSVHFAIPDLGGRVSEIVNYSMSVTDDDGRSVRYIVVERSATFTLSNRDSFTVTFIFADEMGNNMTRSVHYDTMTIKAACDMVPVWILLGIMIILLVVKTTIIAALSSWIHKLRKRDGTVEQEVQQKQVPEELEDKSSLKQTLRCSKL